MPALFAIGALLDTLIVSLLVHLLLAFPSGRLEGRGGAVAVALGYVAGALQVPLLSVQRLRRGRRLPEQPGS